MEQTSVNPFQAILEKFSKRIVERFEKSEKRLYVLIESRDLLEVVAYVFRDLDARYIIVTGLDTPKGIELVYHFAFDRQDKVASIRTIIAHEKPEIESITGIIKGASWIEREIREILGVTFLNHPDPRPFLMAEDWPEGVFPLRNMK